MTRRLGELVFDRRLPVWAIMGLWTLLIAGRARSQEPRPPTVAGPGTLLGVVTDTLGIPLDSVDIFVLSARRHTMSRADGTFRLEDLRAGKYEISARRLGFYPQVHTAKVDEKGGSVSFRLVRTIYGLPPVVTTAARPGLSGVVGDTAYNVVAGAEVAVVASDRRTRSDSTGAFYLDVKPGRYMVRVSGAGYTSRLVSVTVPQDSGRRIVVWLAATDRASRGKEAAALDSLTQRLLTRNPVWSTIMTHEDIAKLAIGESSQLATVGAGKRIDQRCPVTIDGGPLKAPLWTISPSEIEMIEFYTTPPHRDSNSEIVNKVFNVPKKDTRGSAPDTMSTSDCGASIFVWLRK